MRTVNDDFWAFEAGTSMLFCTVACFRGVSRDKKRLGLRWAKALMCRFGAGVEIYGLQVDSWGLEVFKTFAMPRG